MDRLGQTLTDFLDLLDDATGEEVVICGSMSTYLQCCNITPNDIDVLAGSQGTVKHIAELMTGYEVDDSPSQDIGDWLSNKAQKVFVDLSDDGSEQWYMGRWILGGVKIEVAHIVSESAVNHSRDNNYIWENGPDMLPYVKTMDFRGARIRVIPLEIQLTTNLQRGLESRVNEIIRVLNETGYDDTLLNKALSPELYKEVKHRLE